jgi:hypothetical protein
MQIINTDPVSIVFHPILQGKLPPRPVGINNHTVIIQDCHMGGHRINNRLI